MSDKVERWRAMLAFKLWALTRPVRAAGSATSPWCTTWMPKRLLFANEGQEHRIVAYFAAYLRTLGGDPAEAHNVCMDMSAGYAKGAEPPNASKF